MNDLEHDVRAALDEQASLAPPPHEAGRAVARTRRRLGVTIASAVLGLTAVVVVVSIVAIGAVRTPDGGTPATPRPSEPVQTPSPEAPEPETPEPAQLEHGGIVWGLYLAIGENPTDPALETAKAQAEARGYEAGGGEIGCDQPAAEDLGIPADSFAVALYFATRADAETAAALFDPPPVGIVRVTTFCLD